MLQPNSLISTQSDSIKATEHGYNPESNLEWLNVTAKYPFNWDSSSFPFDRNTLSFNLELPDIVKNLSVASLPRELRKSSNIHVDGWRVLGSRITTTPSSNPLKGVYSINIEVDIMRENHVIFWKYAAPAIAAIILTLMSYFIHVEFPPLMAPRFSTIVGSLFLVVLTMKSNAAELGQVNDLNVLDKFYIATIVYILFSGFIAVTGRMLFEHEFIDSKKLRIFSATGALSSTLILLIFIAWLFSDAINHTLY
jgi:hypothetical protein